MLFKAFGRPGKANDSRDFGDFGDSGDFCDFGDFDSFDVFETLCLENIFRETTFFRETLEVLVRDTSGDIFNSLVGSPEAIVEDVLEAVLDVTLEAVCGKLLGAFGRIFEKDACNWGELC